MSGRRLSSTALYPNAASKVRHIPSMDGIESLVEKSEKLTSIFGSWPSFHDAEVIDLYYWRGDVRPGDWDDRNVFPVLTVKVLILEATQARATDAGHDTLATLRF